jgi:hypothetical protein
MEFHYKSIVGTQELELFIEDIYTLHVYCAGNHVAVIALTELHLHQLSNARRDACGACKITSHAEDKSKSKQKLHRPDHYVISTKRLFT